MERNVIFIGAKLLKCSKTVSTFMIRYYNYEIDGALISHKIESRRFITIIISFL